MGRNGSLARLTMCHGAMGAILGALVSAATALCGPPFDGLDRATAAAVFVAISSWMAVGAGITGFILLNVERSAAGPG